MFIRLAASIDKALNIGMTVGENSENLPPMNESKEKSKQHVFKVYKTCTVLKI